MLPPRATNRHQHNQPVSTPEVTPLQEKEESSAAKVLCQMLQKQTATEVDIEGYGDPLDYHYFTALFVEVVEKNITEARGRLTRLIKFTTGEAKELIQLIQQCIQLPSQEGYTKARRLLKNKYGDLYTVI